MFKNILKEIVDGTEGAIAGVLMGFDGIAVDSYQGRDSEYDVENIALEYGAVLGQIKKAADMLNVGVAREVAIQSEQMVTVIGLLVKNTT